MCKLVVLGVASAATRGLCFRGSTIDGVWAMDPASGQWVRLMQHPDPRHW